MTAAAAAERMASAAARNASFASAVSTNTIASGLPPSAETPIGYSPPDEKRTLSSAIHNVRRFSSARRSVSVKAKAADEVISVDFAENISCSAARGNPPFRRRSISEAPRDMYRPVSIDGHFGQMVGSRSCFEVDLFIFCSVASFFMLVESPFSPRKTLPRVWMCNRRLHEPR